MIKRKPSGFPGSLVPLLPDQPEVAKEGRSQAATGVEDGETYCPTPGMCPASRMGPGGADFPNPDLFSSLIYQSSLGASWTPSVSPAKECFLPTSKRSPCTSFPVATSCAGPAWVRSSAPCP